MLWVQALVFLIIGASILIPLLRRGLFAQSFVLANLAIYILQFVLLLVDPLAWNATVLALLFHPSDLLTFRFHTILSSMFLHIGILHIISNVLILYLLGLPLEERVRGPTFAVIYLLTGVGATLVYGLLNLDSNIGALGASGAIMGLAGAFLVLYPRDRIFMILGFIIMPNVPVYLAVGVIMAWQFVLLFFGSPGVAVEAHLGGIAAGMLLAPLLRRSKPVAQRARPIHLDELATTAELRELLDKIEGETVEEVRDVWIEYFLEKARCPVCQGPLTRKGKAVTSECGWERRL